MKTGTLQMAETIDSLTSRIDLNKPWVAAASVGNVAGRKNMLHLIQLRWIAVVGQITTITVAILVFGIGLPLPQMLSVVACLIAFNVGSVLRLGERRVVTNNELFFALMVDVASLTAQLYFSGGTSNPFAFLYLLQVIISAVLLEAWSTWTIVVITGLCLTGLALFAKPLAGLLHDGQSFARLYVQGMIICFMLNASLLVIFITRITRNLRARDEQLSTLRQRAVEEEHIVRMGLLASGAAHELGTPLATMSVILGDWRRMPQFSDDSDLQQEIAEMQAQLQRCKSIVSGILLAAGETRGEASTRTTLISFLDNIAEEWRKARQTATFFYDNRIKDDAQIVLDTTLKQMIFNVLDNAIEASPNWVKFEAMREGQSIKLVVTDAGPGFAPPMLAQFGKPYQSSKGRPGGGLGLFLVVNVARTLGGTVKARNRREGGAIVELVLPLSAITLEEEGKDDVI
ncbi:two-component system sensor histidine kinase RegB [Paucimonas lemoignei]|uniref:histidine kinase n=1 Tax=Paucimonas lemoignei TaxID=29443 RepID=A0A4R3I139_PAULE|nr:ATP-binding protein [Paucimonas lemoignei]TCS39437.1 two-component system sensor histidine kinase RegB [Paucimonas lemoignei]